MRRVLLILALPLALVACSPDLSLEAAREAAHAAEASAEPREALRYYKVAAKRGDLDAMRTLAEAYERGHHRASYHITPMRDGEEVSGFMPILALPGQARLWRSRYERTRDELALDNDLTVLMQAASELDRHDSTPAQRDSARAIRQRLVEAKHPPAMIAEALSTMREDSLRAFTLLEEASDLGSAQACLLRLVLIHAREQLEHAMALEDAGIKPYVSAQMEARHIDEIEACPPVPANRDDMGAQVYVRNLIERGTPEARARLDSLRILGVFARYPHLDPASL